MNAVLEQSTIAQPTVPTPRCPITPKELNERLMERRRIMEETEKAWDIFMNELNRVHVDDPQPKRHRKPKNKGVPCSEKRKLTKHESDLLRQGITPDAIDWSTVQLSRKQRKWRRQAKALRSVRRYKDIDLSGLRLI